jgi:hypothetical protein
MLILNVYFGPKIAKAGVKNIQFKGFMADCAQANFMAIRKIFGSRNP